MDALDLLERGRAAYAERGVPGDPGWWPPTNGSEVCAVTAMWHGLPYEEIRGSYDGAVMGLARAAGVHVEGTVDYGTDQAAIVRWNRTAGREAVLGAYDRAIDALRSERAPE